MKKRPVMAHFLKKCTAAPVRDVIYKSSVTILDEFWNFLATNFLTKWPKYLAIFEATVKSITLFSKTCCGYFLGIFWTLWATFYFNIWSHCKRVKVLKFRVNRNGSHGERRTIVSWQKDVTLEHVCMSEREKK